MKRFSLLIIFVLLLSIFSFSSVAAEDIDITLEGTFTGSYTLRFTDILCDPNNTPVTFSGWVEVTGLETNGAVMFGLIDIGLYDSGDSAWGSGAYTYLGHISTNVRVGPSDGFMGGELNQIGANTPYVADGPNHIDFSTEIYDGQIIVTYNGNNYVDTYGDIEDANLYDAYPGNEFDTGAYVGFDTYPDTNLVDYEITISGCSVTGDSEPPITSNISLTPDLVSVNGDLTLSALVDDTTTGGSNIVSAEYSLNGFDWYGMSASDSLFDSPAEAVTVTYPAPTEAGVYGDYQVCVRGTDAAGNIGAVECISLMLVVYDPEGGFVTGGGWIDSPAGAFHLSEPILQTAWDQGFEANTDGWFDSNTGWYGLITQVPSGTEEITAALGNYFAVAEGDNSSGPFSRFDGYRDTWPGTYYAEIDVYFDPAWAAGQGFDYSVAASGSDGNHQRDYIFHVTKDTSTGKLLVAGSNNTNFVPREDLENINHYEITQAGWYTLQHKFYDNGGALAVDLNLLDSGGNILFTETRYNAADLIPEEVGGNRYSWFTFINVEGGIAVDNHQLILFSTETDITGKATFGFVSKYKKGAEVPTGNTEFVFQAADLNFHSSSYDWLLVTGSDYAKFKGTGTINGEGEYKFQIWAGDNDPDTFRIKIWYEEGENEIVVYDNGMDQAIGGGSIVIHTK